MKKITVTIISFVLCSVFVLGILPLNKTIAATSYSARAYDTGAAGLLVRYTPSTDSGGDVVVPDGTAITITEEYNGFGLTTYNGSSGWVRLRYTQLIGDHSVQEPTWGYITPETYTVCNTQRVGLALRTSPTDDSPTYGYMMEGAKIQIEAIENGWGYTTSYGGHHGWADMSCLTTSPVVFSVSGSASGQYQVRAYDTGQSTLLVRNAPSLDAGGITTIVDGEVFTISQESNGFGYATYKGYSGWVRLMYTQLLEERPVQAPAGGYIEPAIYTICNTENYGLALRTAPSDDTSTYGYMMEGTQIRIEAIENGWGYTSDYAGHCGWARMEYLTDSSKTTDHPGGSINETEPVIQMEEFQSVNDGQYVTDAYSMQIDAFGGCDYHIPQINLPGNDAAAINREIYDKYYSAIQDALYYAQYEGSYGNPGMFKLYYDWYVNGDILSLVVQSNWMDAMHDVDVYNVSISSTSRLDHKAVYQAAGLSDEAYEYALKQSIEQEIWSRQAGASNYYDNYRESDLAESTSASNLDSAMPYFNMYGQLCVWMELKYTGSQNTWNWKELIVNVED